MNLQSCLWVIRVCGNRAFVLPSRFHKFDRFFGFFLVWSSLQRAMEPVDEAPEEGSTPLWSHYVELWSHLLEFSLDGGLQSTAEADETESFEELVASDVGNVGISVATLRESVFDSIMHCVIKAMTELNLKYKAKAPATIAPNTGASPSPLILFLLVPFEFRHIYVLLRTSFTYVVL